MVKLFCIGALFLSALSFADKGDPRSLLEQELRRARSRPASLARDAEEARLLYWLAKYNDDQDTKRQLVDVGLSLMEKADASNSSDSKLLISWIALKGEAALLKSKVVALTYLIPLEKAALRLKSLDENFGFHAADRILGRLYHQAPSIISIGSSSKARKHFENAMKADGSYPENMLFFAEYLMDIGEKEKAIELARAALRSPLLKKYPLERSSWEAMGRKILAPGVSE